MTKLTGVNGIKRKQDTSTLCLHNLDLKQT